MRVNTAHTRCNTFEEIFLFLTKKKTNVNGIFFPILINKNVTIKQFRQHVAYKINYNYRTIYTELKQSIYLYKYMHKYMFDENL